MSRSFFKFIATMIDNSILHNCKQWNDLTGLYLIKGLQAKTIKFSMLYVYMYMYSSNNIVCDIEAHMRSKPLHVKHMQSKYQNHCLLVFFYFYNGGI